MNIDRLVPKSIRTNDAPIENMLEELEVFADTIGGPAWRARRARSTSMERSLALYLDEDYEFLDPEKQVLDGEDDGEEISVAFTAARLLPDDEEDPDDDFSNVYKLSYTTNLPLTDISTMPLALQEKMKEEQQLEAEFDVFAGGIVQEEEISYPTAITESNTIEYTVSQKDGSISFEQFINYSSGDAFVKGASYASEIMGTVVHTPDRNGHALELLTQQSSIEQERENNPGESILTMNDLEQIVTSQRGSLELTGHSLDDHAKRILALLSLIRGGMRLYRSTESK